jgi:hypothetical protein
VPVAKRNLPPPSPKAEGILLPASGSVWFWVLASRSSRRQPSDRVAQGSGPPAWLAFIVCLRKRERDERPVSREIGKDFGGAFFKNALVWLPSFPLSRTGNGAATEQRLGKF